jgi:hypothetical protein
LTLPHSMVAVRPSIADERTLPLPIRSLNAIRRSYICDWVFTVEEVIADVPKPGF